MDLLRQGLQVANDPKCPRYPSKRMMLQIQEMLDAEQNVGNGTKKSD